MSILISPKFIIKFILFGLIPFSILLGFVITGFHYVPVNYTIGKCMMDYTSPSTYSERLSPLKSLEMELEGADILICYGSPAAKTRKIFGDLVPYDQLWRFGANEPTRFYTNSDLVVGEVVVPKGRYSLYAIPGKKTWEIFISESTYHWGNDINEKVREVEIGSFEVKAEYNSTYVEDFTIRTNNDELIIEWEKIKVRIPIVNLGEG